MQIYAHVVGREEVGRMIDRLGRESIKRLPEALMAAAEPIVEEAQRIAPRDPKTEDHMADSITAEVRSRRGATVEVLIGPDKDHFYGKFQELGTKHHKAQPFLRPAMDTKSAEAIEAFRREMSRGL